MKINKNVKKAIGIVLCVGIVGAVAVPAFAAATGNAKTVIENFLGYIQDIFVCLGAMLGVWGVGQLALSFKDDNPESKSRAMMMVIVAAILIGVGTFATTILSGTGLTPGSGFIGS